MPLTKIEIERLFAAAGQRIEEAFFEAREEAEQTLRDLRSALLTDTPTIDVPMALTATHRSRLAQAVGPHDKISPILMAAKLSSGALAQKLGIDRTLISKWRSGARPIRKEMALKVQDLTRSKGCPDGIPPTKAYWPGGVEEE